MEEDEDVIQYSIMSIEELLVEYNKAIEVNDTHIIEFIEDELLERQEYLQDIEA